MDKTKIPKLMLKGISQENGTAFKREIRTLDEVRESGIYLLVGNDVGENKGLPPAEYCNCKQCYFEALLEVSRNSSLNGKTDKETIGQKLTITNSSDGSTNTYYRSWSAQHNSAKWTPWLMSVSGDITIVAPTNDYNERLSVLSTNIAAEKSRAESEEEALKNNIESVEKIEGIVQLHGADNTGVYKAIKGLQTWHRYRITLPHKWDISNVTEGAIFELYYKKEDGTFEILASTKVGGTIHEFYEITWPLIIPQNADLVIYIRANKGETITAIIEDITFDIEKNAGTALYIDEQLKGTSISAYDSDYVTVEGEFHSTANYRTALTKVKKGDIFYISGTSYNKYTIKPFILFDNKMNNVVTYANPIDGYKEWLFQTQCDGVLQCCFAVQEPYKIVKLDKEYLSNLMNADLSKYANFTEGYIQWKDGGYTATSTVNQRTGFIPTMGFDKVEISTNLVSNANVSTGIAFYDADRNYISGIQSPYNGTGEDVRAVKIVEYDIPANAEYLRSTIFKEFADEFVLRLKKNEKPQNVETKSYSYDSLTWTSGYPYYNTGVIAGSSLNKYCTINVDGREYAVIEAVVAKTALGVSPGIVFYDENDKYITGHQYPNYGVSDASSVVITPEVRRYRIPRATRKIRLACRNDISNAFYCTLYGEVASKHESITELKKIAQQRRNNLLVGSPELYISPIVSEAYSSLNNKKTSELYAEWDSMLERFPEYISRGEDLGEVTKNGTTYALRQYTIGYNKKWLINHEPTKDEVVINGTANYWQERDDARKILIPIGMHGEEKTACWGAMLAFKELLESNEKWAVFIKSNFVLKVIPSVNPSGFNDNQRASSNGSVMNREESVDAPENIMLLDWVEKNKDAFVLLDFHGTQGRYAYLPCWDGAPLYDIVKRATIQLSSSLYRNYKEFYDSICDGYGTTYAPFLIAKYSPERAYFSFIVRIWEDYAVPGFALETPTNLMIPNSDGTVNTTLSGLIDQNDLRNCKIAKDLLINCIQIFGSIDNIGDYYVR